MANMELIETKTVGAGGIASISFTSIPQTYTDLKVVISFRGTSAELYEVTALRFNGVNANLSSRTLEGNGSSAGSVNNGYMYLGSGNGNNTTANVFSNIEAYIPNYSVGGINKSVSIDAVGENNATTIYMQLTSGLWANTAAITSVEIVPTGNFIEGSSFSLYGISAVPASPKATGGIVSQDATYWYHMFPYTSTFTPTSAITADCLLIAGGGGGSNGGGGAGGLRLITSQSLTTTNYTVTVGAGGSGANGNNSSFNSNSATGGGKGGGATGNSGGSGGGAGNDSPQTGGAGNAGGYTPVEGYAGGNGTGNSAGGGGGAGGAGSNSTSGAGGNGGPGTNTYSSWADATFTGAGGYYAGGGGGASANIAGIGGVGGGGLAELESTQGGRSGATNTGSGGGGGWLISSGAGGSGLVIIRYAK